MRILLFAQVKNLVGKPELEMKTHGPLSADEFWNRLLSIYPVLSPQRRLVRLAINGEFADPTSVLQDTDEVALIPPVSGG